jgi:acetoin utilization deacetylase AcuC-like enzyme
MLSFRLVYSDRYLLPFGHHVFPSQKYKLAHDRLLELGAAVPQDFVEPQPATDEDILLVHTPLYVQKLKTGTLSVREELELEVPYSQPLVEAFWLMAGGSILAAELALRDGVSVHLGGGFHHAFPDHGEGFCVVNDIAIAIRKMQQDGRIKRAMTVDCDVHQGNGTAVIFGGHAEPFPPPASWSASIMAPPPASETMVQGRSGDVFTISLHQLNNYPIWKPASSIDINLPDGATDSEYLYWLEKALISARRLFEPELLSYVAGADPYCRDQLGGLALTVEGLRQRDEMVLSFARDWGVPVMVTFAGGYAEKLEDTVAIHANTVLAAGKVFAGAGAKPRPSHVTGGQREEATD